MSEETCRPFLSPSMCNYEPSTRAQALRKMVMPATTKVETPLALKIQIILNSGHRNSLLKLQCFSNLTFKLPLYQFSTLYLHPVLYSSQICQFLIVSILCQEIRSLSHSTCQASCTDQGALFSVGRAGKSLEIN